jgi:hypothetical protein
MAHRSEHLDRRAVRLRFLLDDSNSSVRLRCHLDLRSVRRLFLPPYYAFPSGRGQQLLHLLPSLRRQPPIFAVAKSPPPVAARGPAHGPDPLGFPGTRSRFHPSAPPLSRSRRPSADSLRGDASAGSLTAEGTTALGSGGGGIFPGLCLPSSTAVPLSGSPCVPVV